MSNKNKFSEGLNKN